MIGIYSPMNLIITSEHRVGSRWLHYLLADLYNMNVSPEMDVERLLDNQDEIRNRFKDKRIVKFHRATQNEIFDNLRPVNYNIIGVVRNPRDRAVSFTFHNRYHKSGYPFPQKNFDTDEEAVRFTVLEDNAFKEANERQFILMKDGYSTRNFTTVDGLYIWTAYEWMKEDTLFEIYKINEMFLKTNVSYFRTAEIVNKHSFKNKSKGREPGREVRQNLWRRKGIVGDYLNWFDDEMLEATNDDYNRYYKILDRNDKR